MISINVSLIELRPISMKTVLALTFFVITSMTVSGRDSAKGAIRSLDRLVSGNPSTRVVRILGWNGQDQPEKWNILVRDPQAPGRFHEFTIEGRRMLARRVYQNDRAGTLPTATVPLASVVLDSSDAFLVADREGKRAQIGFDTIHYELRTEIGGQGPVWYLELRDQEYRVVGRLEIRASDGNLLRKQWVSSPR
jgi:hypothetical protein